jgi:ubiquinone/menaquinone biosynthesis C-methylase UbiE
MITLATSFWRLSLRRSLIAGLDQVCDCSAELRVGDWAVDMARRFPSAQVIGIDRSSVPKKNKPDNCQFILGDISTDLAQFGDGTFDLVHSRLPPLCCGVNGRFVMNRVTKEQWPNYIAEIFRILKPGGWLQCTESSLPLWEEGGIPEDSNYIKVFIIVGCTFCSIGR